MWRHNPPYVAQYYIRRDISKPKASLLAMYPPENLVVLPLPTRNFTHWKKVTFILISPFQKGQSSGLTVTWAKVLDCRYLLRKICTHVPSVLIEGMYNHLLSGHLFFTFKFSITSPPWSFGLQIISHLVILYFIFISSYCQKNRVR